MSTFSREVNDSYGHAIGDELLRKVAKRLVTVVRKTDLTGAMNAA